MADIFDVLADATRRDLLQVLLDKFVASDGDVGELSVGEMVELLAVSQPTVSKHLKVLRDSRLVRVREGGQHRYYSLDPAPLEAVEDWLVPFLASHFEAAANDGGIAVFAAWSGSGVPGPIRRVAQALPSGGVAGASIGRAAAGASHQARSVVEGATAGVRQRILEPFRKLLGR
ncbi:DNA-binding transcriptional ArsR family regulator [Marisediminicola sp. UYEF4]|uniref:ArsR/SmtB family transcription factor n=1 Tax=Marisediminicola sp. UYEF4 TaxID=1756384 RepID=UPI003396D56F